MKRFMLAAILLWTTSAAPVMAMEIGTFGATYPIDEPDLVEELQQRAKEIDWNKFISKEKMEEKIRNFRPVDASSLPNAPENRIRYVRLTHTLEFDIPDSYGNVLYPKGYQFNPVAYLHPYLPTIVVINGEDEKQVEWFQKSGLNDELKLKLLITWGNYYELSRRLKRPVFYLSQIVADRLDIRFVPSVIKPKCMNCVGPLKPEAAEALFNTKEEWVFEVKEINL